MPEEHSKARGGISVPSYFKSAQSSQPIRAAFSHAGELRGTEQTESAITWMALSPSRAGGRGVAQLAYRFPVWPVLVGVEPQQWLRRELGLKAARYSLGLEALYQIRGNRAQGHVDLYLHHVLDILGAANRTENRRQVCRTLVAMSALPVWHQYTDYVQVQGHGRSKRGPRPTTRYGCDPYIRLQPFSMGRELRPEEAVAAIEDRQYDLFDGMRITFAHPEEFDRHFFFLPTKALSLGSGKRGAAQEMQALALGDAMARRLAMDWRKYGGVLKTPILPVFRHGHTGDFAHAESQGIVHLAGLSTADPHSVRRAVPDLVEIAQRAELISTAEYDLAGRGFLTATAPLWLCDLMQRSRRRFDRSCGASNPSKKATAKWEAGAAVDT